MKKIYLALACVFIASLCSAQEDERMIINPGRETFVHFPSAVLGNKYTMTVFLPEKSVPLSKYYPVVYLLGAGPKQAQEAQAFLEKYKALVVGINFEEADYKKDNRIAEFISRELMPYIDTNYLTLTRPENRVIAARGKSAAIVAAELFAKPNLFGGLSLAGAGDAVKNIQLPDGPARVFVAGTQSELALAQQTLEAAGLSYGTGFALAYAGRAAGWFNALPLDYFFAPADKAALRRLSAKTDVSSLSLDSEDTALLTVTAVLKNGRKFAYVPVSLRVSPPYLDWDASRGALSVLPGAEAGTVQIRGGVDKTAFRTKIKLKKQ